jgi:hypothetical protein
MLSNFKSLEGFGGRSMAPHFAANHRANLRDRTLEQQGFLDRERESA